MSPAEIVILVFTGMGLLLSANKHGKPKTGNENFWVSLVAQAISLSLLWWAGLFH